MRLSLISVGRLLAQLGLSCQKPLRRAWQQDLSRVDQWLKEEFLAIKRRAKQNAAEIFFENESGVQSNFHSSTTWAKQGETPMIKVTGARFSLNMISAVSPRGVLRFKVVQGGVGAGVFIEFLKRLLHGMKRPVYLIVDGHPAHRAQAVTKYVQSLQGKLVLFFLPPYSP